MARLKLNATMFKHLCVSHELYLGRLIENPIAALQEANIDCGNIELYVNVLPSIVQHNNTTMRTIMGIEICFFLGEKASLARSRSGDFYSRIGLQGIDDPLITNSGWSHESSRRRSEEEIRRMISTSVTINEYGLYEGKVHDNRFFYKIFSVEMAEWRERKQAQERYRAEKGVDIFHTPKFAEALNGFFFDHKPFEIDKQGRYQFDQEEIGLEGLDVQVVDQFIRFKSSYGVFGSSFPSVLEIGLFSDIFSNESSPFKKEEFSEPDDYDGVPRLADDDDRSYLEIWKESKTKTIGGTIRSQFVLVFDDVTIPVLEEHDGLFGIDESETGVELMELDYEFQNLTAYLDEILKPDQVQSVSEDAKRVVERFIEKFQPTPAYLKERSELEFLRF